MTVSRTLVSLLLISTLGSSAAARAATSPVVRLEVVPARTLPGVPVNLLISVTNPGDQPVEIPNSARLHVTPPSGEPFVAVDDESSSPVDSFPLYGEPVPSVIVAPGETKSWALPVHPLLVEPLFFSDERLSWPGRYLLRLEVVTGSTPPFQTVTSNEAALLVIEPTGPDLIVWQRMLAMSDGRGWSARNWTESGAELAKFVMQTAPTSGYTPYVAHLEWGQTPAELRDGITYAISLAPDGPVADTLAGFLAGWHLEAGEEALTAGDLEQALEMFAEARRRTIEINRTTKYRWIREFTERFLTEELDSEAEVRGRFATNVKAMTRFTEPATPFVDCVDPGSSPNDPFIVWFGYDNPNRGRKFVDRGKGNELTPHSTKEQPPRVFQPGRQKYGFSVTTHGDRVTWALDGKTATAARDSLPRCTVPASALLPLRPAIDCVKKEGEQVIIVFGYENPNAVAIRVAEGAENQLTGSEERPPTIFEPGRHYSVFRVNPKHGKVVSWS